MCSGPRLITRKEQRPKISNTECRDPGLQIQGEQRPRDDKLMVCSDPRLLTEGLQGSKINNSGSAGTQD